MRNLKRALSLVMAMAMLVGMMVIGASAASYDDFTDKDKIVNQEAVSTMYALGVINGKEDGSYFDPTANVTRSEMAKMIVVALHGGKDPVLGVKAKPTFSDIDGHWAEAYIEYCASNEIISGRGNGKFDPDANVTGTEAAKMLLVALGYKASVFGFTGESWAINVNTQANDVRAKLYDNLDSLDPSKAITRDEAAQMLYNGTTVAKMLVMTPSETVTSGEVTYNYTYSGTMLNLKFNASVFEGVITGNEYASLGGGIQKAGEYRFAPVLKDNENYSGAALTVAGTTTPDMLGKSYKVIIKDSQKAGVYNVVYGEPSLSDMNNIYTVSANKTVASGTTATSFQNDVKAAGINNVTNASTYVVYDDTGVTPLNSFSALQGATADGKVIQVVDNNNDGYAEYILVSTPFIGKVTAYNAEGNNGEGYITIANKGSVPVTTGKSVTGEKFNKVVGVENLAKDDIVSYMVLNDKFYVTKLETVTGTITSQTGIDKVKLDGVEYKASSLGSVFDDDNSANLVAATALGKEATLYLDASGYVVYAKAAEDFGNYLYVDSIEGLGAISGVKAKVAMPDGTTQTITVASVEIGGVTYKPGGTSPDGNLLDSTANGVIASFSAGIYKYNVSNGEYKLKALAAGETDSIGSGAIHKGNAAITASTTADSKTVFLLKSGSSWTTYTGVANVPNMNSGVTATIAKDATTNVAEFVVVTAGAPTEAKSIYILSDKVTAVKDGDDTVYTVKALVDGVYTDSLVLDGAGVTATTTVVKGLYTGDGAALNNGKLPYSLVDNASLPTGAYYSNPTALSKVSNGNVTGLIAGYGTTDGATSVATASGTLTLTSDTKVIIITGDTADKVLTGVVDDLNYDSVAPANNSVIVMTRASTNSSDVGYYQAGIVYVIR